MLTRSGSYLKLIRLLNCSQQADLALALKTKQAIVAQIESNKYTINPNYANLSSKLYSLNPAFLLKLQPPVFSEEMTVFRIFPSDKTSAKLLNQLDNAIRTTLPSLCDIQEVDRIYVLTTGHKYDWSKRFRASLFMFLSSIHEQSILIKIKEDNRDQFYNAFIEACTKMQIEYKTDIIQFDEFEDFFSEDIIRGEQQTEQFLSLLESVDIPDRNSLAKKYYRTMPNESYWQSERGKHLQEQAEFDKENREVLHAIAELMRKQQITIEELSTYLKNTEKKENS